MATTPRIRTRKGEIRYVTYTVILNNPISKLGCKLWTCLIYRALKEIIAVDSQLISEGGYRLCDKREVIVTSHKNATFD